MISQPSSRMRFSAVRMSGTSTAKWWMQGPSPALFSKNRHDEIVSLRIDFGTRHRILRRAAHRFHMTAQRRSVAQNDLYDALSTGHRPGELIVPAQLHLLPQRQHLAVAHALLV